MSDSDSDVSLVTTSTDYIQSSWKAVNQSHVSAEHLNLPDLDELEKKFRWMLPDLVDGYKQAALEAAHPAMTTADNSDERQVSQGISQRDILDKARELVIAKYPSAAKSRTNPAPAPKVYARFNSFSDIDNMALHADTVDPDEPRPKQRKGKRKESASKACNEPRLSLEEPSQAVFQMSRTSDKRKAVEDVAVLGDTQPNEMKPAGHQNKRMRVDSDKENDMASESETRQDPVLWTANVPTHIPRTSTAMNVSRKRTLKDSRGPAENHKRLKLDNQQQSSSRHPSTTQHALSVHTASFEPDRGAHDASCEAEVDPIGEAPHETTSEAFSDQEELFTQIIQDQVIPDSEDDEERNVSRDISLDDIPSGIFSEPSDMSASAPSTPQKPPSPTSSPIQGSSAIPLSQADVEPSLRSKPTTIVDNTSPASAISPKHGTITCFRIAEALRIRTNAMSAPVLVSEASKPRQPVEIELFARINLTYRAGTNRIFVFEDIWFPNKPPVLRAVHSSPQKCEQEVPELLRENSGQSTEGGFLCRAIVALDTSRATNPSGDFHGEVVCLRTAEWDEVEHVRSLVEPQYQQL